MKNTTTLLAIVFLGNAQTGNAEPESQKKNCECSTHETSRASILNGETSLVTYQVVGMSCGGCSSGLSSKLFAVEGVELAEADHETSTAKLSYKAGQTTPEKIVSAIEKAGYKVTGERLTLQVAGMSCEGCEKGLSAKVRDIEGVLSVEKASHESGTLDFTVSLEACKNTIQKKIEEAGYKVTP